MDGSIADFGSRFWRIIRQSSELNNKIENKLAISNIVYTDQFLCTPLATMLLGQVLYELKNIYEMDYAYPKTDILTQYTYQSAKKNRKTILDKWLSENLQRDVQNSFYEYFGLNVNCLLLDKEELEHHRSLSLFWEDGTKTKINLDHGFGFIFYKGADDYTRQRCKFKVNDSISSQVDLMCAIEKDKAVELITKPDKTTLITIYSEER